MPLDERLMEKVHVLKPVINISIDDRERSRQVRQSLAAMDGVAIEIRRLAVGDFQVDGRFLFERKTLQDFAISVIDGRFFRQMTQLAMSPLKGVLILEGGGHDLPKAAVRRDALQGALITATLILGIPVLRSLDPAESARLMIYAARQLTRVAVGGLSRPGYRPRGKRKRQLYILQGLPGVGPARAERLLQRFGSVQNILNASPENLTAVEGIGTETARNIRWAVGESQAAYGPEADLFII